MWQSSLYKNPFMALQVGNARGDLLVAYAIKISSVLAQRHCGRLKSQTWFEKT